MQTVIIVGKCICDKCQPSPSLLSCFDTGKKSTPISGGIPELGGVGIFPESTIWSYEQRPAWFWIYCIQQDLIKKVTAWLLNGFLTYIVSPLATASVISPWSSLEVKVLIPAFPVAFLISSASVQRCELREIFSHHITKPLQNKQTNNQQRVSGFEHMTSETLIGLGALAT